MEVFKESTDLLSDQEKQASDLTNIATWMDLNEENSENQTPETTLTTAAALLSSSLKEETLVQTSNKQKDTV